MLLPHHPYPKLPPDEVLNRGRKQLRGSVSLTFSDWTGDDDLCHKTVSSKKTKAFQVSNKIYVDRLENWNKPKMNRVSSSSFLKPNRHYSSSSVQVRYCAHKKMHFLDIKLVSHSWAPSSSSPITGQGREKTKGRSWRRWVFCNLNPVCTHKNKNPPCTHVLRKHQQSASSFNAPFPSIRRTHGPSAALLLFLSTEIIRQGCCCCTWKNLDLISSPLLVVWPSFIY